MQRANMSDTVLARDMLTCTAETRYNIMYLLINYKK